MRLTRFELAASAALTLLGITGFVLGVRQMRRTEEELEGSSTPGRPRPPSPKPGTIKPPTQNQAEAVMRGGYHVGQYTSFFPRDVEIEVIRRLEAYKHAHGIKFCTPVPMDPGMGETYDEFQPGLGYKWLDHAEPATEAVLMSLYPTGIPWDGQEFVKVDSFAEAEQTTSLWRYWLWRRVYHLAETYVCGFTPET